MARPNGVSRGAALATSTNTNAFLSPSQARGSVNPNKPSTSRTPTKSRNASPKKQQRAYEHQLEQVAEDEAASVARLELLLESFELEAAARVKSLRQKKADQLAALERKWRSAVVQLDDQLRSLTVGDFVDKYNSSRDEALRQIVQHTIKRAPMGDEELNRRKRNAPGSPRRNGAAAGSSIEDVFGTTKKARPAPLQSAKKAGAGQASATRGASAAGRRTRDNSPTTARSTRTVRSSTTRTAPRVRASLTSYSFNPNLPPTPSIRSGTSSTASRRPRRGESIITTMYSVNGSPLGSREVQYDEEEVDEDEQEQDGSDGWDMMSAGEASRVEEQSARKGKRTAGTKAPAGGNRRIPTSTNGMTSPIGRSSRSGSTQPSSKSGKKSVKAPERAFDFYPPGEAPTYDASVNTMLAEMRKQIDAFPRGHPARVVLQDMYNKFATNVEEQ